MDGTGNNKRMIFREITLAAGDMNLLLGCPGMQLRKFLAYRDLDVG
jgi:hypothetical protein